MLFKRKRISVDNKKKDDFNLCFISLNLLPQVEFDGKRPEEHLQFLNNVISILKPDLKADVRASSRVGVAEEMRLFLMTNKCKCLPSDEDGFRRKETIHPVLHWVLSEYESLRKRTSLSRYLIPVDVPMGVFVDADEWKSRKAFGGVQRDVEEARIFV